MNGCSIHSQIAVNSAEMLASLAIPRQSAAERQLNLTIRLQFLLLGIHSIINMMPRRSKSPLSRSFTGAKTIKFCHFRNGMCMGEMKCFQRQGTELVLLDSGDVAVATYRKGKLQGGTTIFTANNQLYSLFFDHNILVEIAAQDHERLIYLQLKHGIPEGQATIINFSSEDICYVVYKQGKIVGKSHQRDTALLNRVFTQNNLDALIPLRHLKSLDFQFKALYLEVIKRTSTITVGFHKNGFMNGLGFTLFKNSEKGKGCYTLLEKGYYKDSQLCGIGQKRYQNGNLYVGEFSYNMFQGRGLLVNTMKNNWVKGIFRDGNMIEMVQYSNEGSSQNPRIAEMLGTLHKKKSSWIDTDIRFQQDIQLDTFMDSFVRGVEQYKNDGVLDYQQRKEIVLKRIQENFVPTGTSQSFDLPKQSPRPKLSHPGISQNTSGRKKINSFESFHDAMNSRLRLSPAGRTPRGDRELKNIAKSSILQSISQKRGFPAQRQLFQNQKLSQDSKEKMEHIPINVYNPEESLQHSSPPRQEQQKVTFPTQKRHSLSLHQLESEASQSKRSMQGSRRHRIFGGFPDQRINTSRSKNSQSPSKSFMRQAKINPGDTSGPETLQELGHPVSRSRKMVRSRIFQQQQRKQSEDLPTFRYSRFNLEGEVSNTPPKKRRIF